MTCLVSGPSRPMTRIGVSNPPATENPPVWLTLFARSASSTSWREAPYSASFTGSTSTWYCFRPPPMAMTWAMPLVFSNRGRTAQSASVRRASCRCASDGNTISRDCPAIVARAVCAPSAAVGSHAGTATGTASHVEKSRRSPAFHTNRVGSVPAAPVTRSA